MSKQKTEQNALTRKFEEALEAYAPMEHCEHTNLVVDFDDMNREEEELYNKLADLLIKNRLPKHFSDNGNDVFFAPICICMSNE